MLRRLLVDSLEASRGLAGVGDEGSGLSVQALLFTDIKRFHLHYEPGKAPYAYVALSLRLTELRTGAALGGVLLEATRQSADDSPRALVAAFGAAVSEALEKSNAWVLQTLAATR
jgi:ABC-type uncharacterized transport system auxiliary subunit